VLSNRHPVDRVPPSSDNPPRCPPISPLVKGSSKQPPFNCTLCRTRGRTTLCPPKGPPMKKRSAPKYFNGQFHPQKCLRRKRFFSPPAFGSIYPPISSVILWPNTLRFKRLSFMGRGENPPFLLYVPPNVSCKTSFGKNTLSKLGVYTC